MDFVVVDEIPWAEVGRFVTVEGFLDLSGDTARVCESRPANNVCPSDAPVVVQSFNAAFRPFDLLASFDGWMEGPFVARVLPGRRLTDVALRQRLVNEWTYTSPMGAPINGRRLGSGATGGHRPRRCTRAVAVGVVVGGAAAVVAAIALEPTRPGFGPWSRLWGTLTATAAFALTLMATGPGRRVGMFLAAAVFAIVGLGVLWFMIGFGFPSLLSLEGLWMWPLAIGSLLASGVIAVRFIAAK